MEDATPGCRPCEIGWGLIGIGFGLIILAIGLDLLTGGALSSLLTPGQLATVTHIGETGYDSAG